VVKFLVTEHSYYRIQLKGWSLLALGALGAAGILALLLALSRTPVIGPLLPWSADFFYRALVTHVMLSFQVWFLTMLAVNFLLAQRLEPDDLHQAPAAIEAAAKCPDGHARQGLRTKLEPDDLSRKHQAPAAIEAAAKGADAPARRGRRKN